MHAARRNGECLDTLKRTYISLSVPLEIITEILTLVLESVPPQYWLFYLRQLLLVSRLWHDVLVGNPLFWRVLSVHINVVEHSTLARSAITNPQTFGKVLARTGQTTPLQLHCHVYEDAMDTQLCLHAQLINCVVDAVPRCDTIDIIAAQWHLDGQQLALLFLSKIPHHPLLKRLTINCQPAQLATDAWSPLITLNTCSRLRHLTLSGANPDVGSLTVTSLRLIKPSVQELGDLHIRYPALEALDLILAPGTEIPGKIRLPGVRRLGEAIDGPPNLRVKLDAPQLQEIFCVVDWAGD
jgi:hypothetical protein